MNDTWLSGAGTATMQATNHDGRDTMRDEQNIERGGADVECQSLRVRGSEPEQDGESQGYRWGTESEEPANNDMSDADAADDSDVEGRAIKPRFAPERKLEDR